MSEGASSDTREQGAAMVNRTYYLSTDLVRDLDAAVTRIFLGRLAETPRHRILDAIIRTGLAHIDEVDQHLANGTEGTP